MLPELDGREAPASEPARRPPGAPARGKRPLAGTAGGGRGSVPLTGTAGRPGSRRPPAAALIAAALLAGFAAAAAPPADGQLAASVSTDAADPTALREVPFALSFNKTINASTLEASDIEATSGTVRDLRNSWVHGADFGGNGSGDGQLDKPHGVAVDGAGRVYVADEGNGRVSAFDRAGNHLGHVGGPFLRPEDVAAGGPHGRVYVADTGNHTVRVYDAAWRHVHDINYTTPGSQFDTPSGVAVDSSGNAYVADRLTHRVYVFDREWQYVRDVGGPYNQPNGVAVGSSGAVYVADSGNHTVRVYDAAGRHVADIEDSFAYPFAVDVDPAGNVFVADAFNSRVAVFDPARQHVANLTHPYDPLRVVTGVAVDPATGDAYAAGRDNHRVSAFDAAYAFDVADPADGRILSVSLPAGRVQDLEGNWNEASGPASIGVDRSGPTPNVTSALPGPTNAATVGFLLSFDEDIDAATLDASDIETTSGTVLNVRAVPRPHADFGGNGTGDGLFDGPYGVAVGGPSGRVYVTDHENDRVQIFDSGGRYSGALPGPFDGPYGVAVDSSGNVYVADSRNNRVVAFNSTGHRIENMTNSLDGPSGVAVDSSGNVYVADTFNGRIQIFDSARRPAGAIPEPSSFPYGVAVGGPSGHTYVADAINNRVRVYNSTGMRVGDISDPSDPLNFPSGVAVDSSGNVYVADTYNDRVRVFDSSWNYTGDLHGRFDNPIGVAAGGPSGYTYVADTYNDRVRVFDARAYGSDTAAYGFDVADPRDGENLTAVLPAGRVTDLLGNPNGRPGSASILIDRTAPEPAVSSALSGPTAATTIRFAVEFGEDVDGFGAAGVALSGTAAPGGAGNFTGAGASYSFDASPTMSGTILVDIPRGAARDAAGNPSNASARYRATHDATPPAPSIAPAARDPTGLLTVPFSLAFDEPVDAATLEAADIEITSGTVENLRGAWPRGAALGGPGAGDGELDQPHGVAADGAGRIYVADANNHRVSTFDGTGRHLGYVGAAGDFSYPQDVAAGGPYGRIYVADAGNDRVRVYGPAGDHVHDIENSFVYPSGVAVGPSGRVYVADGLGGRVHEFDHAWRHARDVGGPYDHPNGVAVDGSGRVYVADSNNATVRVYGPAGGHVRDIYGQFDYPSAVDVDPAGNAYVADQNNGRVRVFDPAGRPAANLTVPSGAASGVAVDPATGAVYAASRDGHAVSAFDAAYAFDVEGPDYGILNVSLPAGRVDDLAGNGNAGSNEAGIGIVRAPVPSITTEHGSRTGAEKIAFRLEFDRAMNASTLGASDIEASSGTVQNLRPLFRHEATFGGHGSGEYQFNRPIGVAVNASGYIYVADSQNHRVQIFDQDRRFADRISGPQLYRPTGIALDGSGHAYVANNRYTHNNVPVFDAALQRVGAIDRHAPPGSFNQPYGVAVDGSGHAFVADSRNDRIAVFDSSRQYVRNITGGLDRPAGVAADGSGRVYVADSRNDRVAVFDSAGNSIANVTERIDEPYGVAVDDALGILYVASADSGIQFFNSAWDRIGHVPGSFNSPRGVALDSSSGSLYVTSHTGHQLHAFNASAYAFEVANPGDLQDLTVGMPAGRARDAAGIGNEASGTASIFINRTGPIPVVGSPHPDPTGSPTIRFTVEFGEDVDGFAADNVTLSGTANHGGVEGFAGGPASYSFAVSPASDGTILVDIPANVTRSAALGNFNDAAERFSMTYDSTLPTPDVTAAQASPTNATTISFQVAFTRHVTGFGAGDVVISGNATHGGAENFAGGGDSYSFEVSPTSDGIILVDIPEGAARNGTASSAAAARFSIEYDGTAPAANVTAAQSSPTNATTIAFTANFTEPVYGFAAGDVVLTGAAPGIDAGSFAALNATTYRFDASPAGNGTLHVDIPQGAARDGAGNGNAAAGRFSIEHDGKPPVPEITSTRRNQTSAATIDFAVDFGENVTGFGAADVVLSGTANRGGLENFAGGGDSYSFDVSPASDGTILVDIPQGAAEDAAGNPSGAAARFSIAYRGTPPTLVTSEQPDPTNAPTIRLAVEFAGGVTGFVEWDVVLSGTAGNGGVENFTETNSSSYAFAVSPTSDGTVTVEIAEGAAEYADSGEGTAAARFTIEYDGTGPTPTVAAARPGPTSAASVGFRLGFGGDIDPSTVAASDINASSGNVTNLRAVPRHHGNIGGPGSGSGSLSDPTGVAVDAASGNIYVADGSGDRVHVFDPGGNFAGALPGGFNGPTGVAVDGSGSVYVADYPPGRIAVFDSALRSTANITRAGMDYPYAVAVDGSGNIYALDSVEAVIQIFNSSGDHVAQFPVPSSNPLGVAVNASGYIYVADRNGNSVDIFGPSRAPAGALPGPFDGPLGVAVDGATGRVYVADTGNGSVKVFDSAAAYVGALPGPFDGPTGVATGPSGRVYVADRGNRTVQAFDMKAYEFDVADPDDRRTLAVGMPAGRVQDRAGNANEASNTASVYVSRTAPIPAVSSAQQSPTNATKIAFAVEFDEGVEGFGPGGIALSGTAGHAGAVNFAGAGASYSFAVSPVSDGTIRVDIPAGAARNAPGIPSAAAARFPIAYDGTPPTPAVAPAQPGPTNLAAVPFNLTFSNPIDASTLEASDIVASSGNATNLRAAAWHHGGTFGGPGSGGIRFDGPAGIAVDASGNIYVADRGNDRVRVLDPAGGLVADIAGLGAPRGVAVDASGKIYVADTGSDAVRVYRPDRTHAADLPGPFSEPTGIAVGGPHGRVHVAELGGSVRVHGPDGNGIGNITGLGNLSGVAVDASGSIYVPRAGSDPRVSIYRPDMTHDADLPGTFVRPTGVAVDASGNIYVAASGIDRVRVYGPDRTGIAEIDNSLDDPFGVAVDPASGALYVTESGSQHGDSIQAFDASYAFDVAGPAEGQLAVGLPAGSARDPAGNANDASNAAGIRVDRTAPAPNVTSAQPDPTGAPTIRFTVEFGEPVTGFEAADVALSGTAAPGGAENFAGAGASYSFDASPTMSGTILVDVPANATRDDAGNGNTAAEQFSIEYDSSLLTPSVTAEQGSPTNASTISFSVDFSRPVDGFEAGDVNLTGTAKHGGVENFTNASAAAYAFDVLPTGDGTILVDVPAGAARDAANATISSIAAKRFSIEYDGTAPAPTVTSAQSNPTNAATIAFTANFTEPVDGFGEEDVKISGAASGIDAGSFDPANSTTYAFAVSPASDGTILVDVPAGAARDEAGNGNTAAEQFPMTRDTEAPAPNVTAAQASPTGESPIAFTVNFTEPVDGFEEGDVGISGAASGIDAGSFDPANSTTYAFAVSPASDGTILVDVPADAARDDAGNGNEAAQFSIEYNGAAPIPTVTSAQPDPTNESPIAFTVNFTKPVTGFGEDDVEISGAASGIDEGSFAAIDNMTYTFTVSPAANGTMLVDVPANVAQAANGNNNTAAAQFSIEYNGAPPPPPPPPPHAPIPIITSAAQASPTGESPIAFTVNFTKPVTGFEEDDVKISGAASGIDEGSFVAVNATTYTFTVSPAANGTVTVDVPAGAALGADGGGSEAARFSIEYDGAAPDAGGTAPFVRTAAITGPRQATIRYSENVTAAGPAYHSIVVGGAARTGELQGNGTAAHVLRFGGDAAARDATGAVTMDLTAITNLAGRPLGDETAHPQRLADGQAPLLESAALDLTAGENGLLTVTFDEAVTAPDARPFVGDIVVRGAGGAVALSAGDIPSIAPGRAGDGTLALGVSGAKRVELNAADLGPAAIELPAAFVSDAPGNAYAPGGQPAVPLAYAPDPSPPVLVKAAFNLAPAGGAAGRLVMTFDEAATAPGAESFPGMIEIRGRSWGGDAAAALSAADMLSVESGSTGDRTFALLASDRARSLLDAAAFSDPESTTLLLPAGFVTNGRAAHAPERAPLDVARDPDRPSFLLAFVLDGSSVAAVYSEPVLAVPSHYANITVGGAAAAGNGGASEAAAYGNNVVVSWNANASTTAAAGSAVGFDLSANVTDAFGNPVVNPGEKSTGGPDGTGQAGKRPVQVGVFARGAGDPSMWAARLGAAAFNAVSSERGYQFYVSVSEHDLPAGAPGAAALRGAHGSGEGPLLYVGPASDTALAGMAGYAAENGITIISHSSAARSLAIGGDPIFRMEPGAAHLARALATEVARGGYGAIVPVVQAGLHGPDYGLLESMESDLEPLGIPFGDPVAFAAGGGGAAAAPIGDAVAAAAGSGTARSVAVVYMGSDMELVAMAGSVPADGPVRERSAWFAAGGAGAGAGSGVAASPAITADAAAIQLARDVRLSAVQFAVERNGMTDYIDRIAAPLVPATSATPAYAAYEAVRALGGALVGAGGDPSLARGNVAGAANLEGGPLGRTGMDGSGDLRLPVTYGAWSVSDVSAEWARAPELLRGLDACGIDLEKSALALPELSAGSTSRPARQTVTNIGTGPMPAVSVSATDWTQFLNGVPLPGPLPFSYTEMAVGLGGASPRPADSTPLAAGTEIPGGTPPGGSVDVDFRINLGGLDALEADIISQTVTFVANCA